MTEVVETPVASAVPGTVPADTAAATPGQRLKTARERRGLSSQKAAHQMHLDPWVIEALESDQFDKIGPSVYAKGHLKRYAGMLGLPAAELMAAAYGSPPDDTGSTIQRSGVRMRTQGAAGIELPWSAIVGAGIVAALILGAVWLRPWRPRVAASAPPVMEARAEVPRAASSATAEPPGGGVGDDGEDAGPASTHGGAAAAPIATPSAAVVASSAAAAAATAPAPVPGAGKARLRLSFSADSRVEVRDANGNSVFAGNGRANSVKTVMGDAPLHVYLGFAGGVQLAINNRVVAIGPQFVAGDVARFEAGADGVLRRDMHAAPSNAAAPQSRPRG